MSLTFPRMFPFEVAKLAAPLTFTPDRVINTVRTRGGAVQAQERGRSLWKIDARTQPLWPGQFDEMQAFFDSLRGGLNKFIFYDPGRARPRSYPGSGWVGITRANGSAFDGTCLLASASGYQVSLYNLPAGYKMLTGDMMCWGWGNTALLHRAMEPVTANSSGQLTVQVEPDIVPGSVPGVVVRLETAFSHFTLSAPVAPKRTSTGGEQIEFTAIQAIY